MDCINTLVSMWESHIDEALQDLQAVGEIPTFDETSFDSEEVALVVERECPNKTVDEVRQELAEIFNTQLEEEARRRAIPILRVDDKFVLNVSAKDRA